MQSGRLSTLSAAMVMARRDFNAILFSRSFIFFLLAPFFPVVIFAITLSIGQKTQADAPKTELGVVMSAADVEAMIAARDRLAAVDPGMPAMRVVRRLGPGETPDIAAELKRSNAAAILSGTPARPVLTGSPGWIGAWRGDVSLIAATALQKAPAPYPQVTAAPTSPSAADNRQDRSSTAQTAQTMLFLLTMILAGMVLSNLVEEKGNKIIEVLAAAIPMDAVFLGKLFAMLAVSFVAIAVWATVGLTAVTIGGGIHDVTAPAVGWPAFAVLGVIYFAMAYLLLGSVFLAIGSMAATVRDVQTLSFPVTMLQLIVFLFSTYAATQAGKPVEWAGMIVPFSSPFTMLARAATDAALWPHLAAIAWQALWVAVSVRIGAGLFRTRVMKSGPAGGAPRRRGLLRRLVRGTRA
ncbi:MAG: ABC transporter permease [Novosphingobium sp.]